MMESWHRVGQKVVCIDARPPEFDRVFKPKNPHPPLVEGQIYTILKVGVFVRKPEFVLEGVGDPASAHSYFSARRFRPVRETSIEQFRALLTPTPEVRRALEDA